MLEGLYEIDWESVQTAYGPATDVPEMIVELNGPDEAARQEAFHAAYGNIFHQGTRYTATPLAVPFVIELAAQPVPKDLPELLSLISHLVAGYFGATHGPRNATGTIWGVQVEPMTAYGETRELLAAIETAAEPAVPLCATLLAHANPSVRSGAARILAGLRQFAARYEVVPRLEDRFTREDDDSVRAMLAFALTHLVDDTRVIALYADPAPVVQVLAAMGATRRGIATEAMATALVGWLSDDDVANDYDDLPLQSDGLASDIAVLLPALGPDRLAASLPMLFTKLATTRDFGAVALLRAALSATFGAGPSPANATHLSSTQRDLLERLANNQGFWMLGNALNVLIEYELPSEREAMAAFLGIEVTTDPIEAKLEVARMMGGFGEQQALDAWRDVLALDGTNAEAQYGAANALIGLERYDEAAAIVGALVEDNPLEARGWFLSGMLSVRNDELEAALDSFNLAIGLADEDEEMLKAARGNATVVLQRLGRAEEALEAWTTNNVPEDADDFYHLGLAQVKAAKYPACIASITRALELRPDHANSHYTIACAYALSGDSDHALAAIATALELDPELAADIAGDSDFASLADDLRFRRLVKPSA